jgi:hypothetical protein
MKKTFITGLISYFFLAVLSFNTSAQEYKNYNLNKYYTPDIVRNGLDLNFGSSGSFLNQSENRSYDQNVKDTINYGNTSGALNSTFSTYKNTRKNESLLQLNLDLLGQMNNYNSKPIDPYSPNSSSLYSNENLGLTYTNKFYNSAKQFISFGVTTRLSFSGGKTKTKDSDFINKTATSKDFFSDLAPFIGAGFGRIETVTDARQAIYIVDDLSKRGVLTRQLSNDEIFRFAQQISKVKNKRFLDARLHKIDEISTVDSFFVNNNLLTKSDAAYFTSLYDNWENGANFERNSGQVFEIQFSPNMHWYNIYNQTDTLNGSSIWNRNKYSNYGISLLFSYNYAKQVNLNWEKTANASLSGSTGRIVNSSSSETFSEDSNKQDNGVIALNGSYSIGYYPSTRTHLSAKLSQNFVKNFVKSYYEETAYTNSFTSITNLGFSAVYYVSPQLSLSGNASVYNNYNKYTQSSGFERENQLGCNFSAALKYSFY